MSTRNVLLKTTSQLPPSHLEQLGRVELDRAVHSGEVGGHLDRAVNSGEVGGHLDRVVQ